MPTAGGSTCSPAALGANSRSQTEEKVSVYCCTSGFQHFESSRCSCHSMSTVTWPVMYWLMKLWSLLGAKSMGGLAGTGVFFMRSEEGAS